MSDASATELDGDAQAKITFKVNLSDSSEDPVSVDFRTVAISAGPEDFEARSGTLRIKAGKRSRALKIKALPDDLDEPDERFKVRLSEPEGAQIADKTGIGTIVDDDTSSGVGGGGGPVGDSPADGDNDGVPDGGDNCPASANADQANLDGDAQGDACDTDDDNDGVANGIDNCQTTPNPDQANTDGLPDGGNTCDADDDNDGDADDADNCPTTVNPDQNDRDFDSLGDACDPDPDNDGFPNAQDACQFGAINWISDDDSDHDHDGCRDGDEDLDDDNDGRDDPGDSCPTGVGAPGWSSIYDEGDYDADGCRDSDEDIDDDGDGITDGADQCDPPLASEQGWISTETYGGFPGTDYDADGCRDDATEDRDDDNDGVPDSIDACDPDPTTVIASEKFWTSGAGLDDDGDGCKDVPSEDSDDTVAAAPA